MVERTYQRHLNLEELWRVSEAMSRLGLTTYVGSSFEIGPTW